MVVAEFMIDYETGATKGNLWRPRASPGAQVVDATGRYIVPGFIDTNRAGEKSL
jgi:adenine deaminase